MSENNTSLFKNDDSEILMPSVTKEQEEESTQLYSKDIREVILAPQVDSLIIPKESVINEHNFIFDFSEIESISVMQKEVLKSIIRVEGDIELYLYKKNGLMSFGHSEKYFLEKIIPLIKTYIFNDEIHIYKNYSPGKPVYEVIGRDFTKMRMRL